MWKHEENLQRDGGTYVGYRQGNTVFFFHLMQSFLLRTDRTNLNSASTQCTAYNVPLTTCHLQRTPCNAQPTVYQVHCPKYNILLSTSHLLTLLPVPNTMGLLTLYPTLCIAQNVLSLLFLPFRPPRTQAKWTHNVITHCETRSMFSTSTSIYSWPFQPVCTTPLHVLSSFPRRIVICYIPKP